MSALPDSTSQELSIHKWYTSQNLISLGCGIVEGSSSLSNAALIYCNSMYFICDTEKVTGKVM